MIAGAIKPGSIGGDSDGGLRVWKRVAMKDWVGKGTLRCAIYRRVSTDQGLEQDFDSLNAKRESFPWLCPRRLWLCPRRLLASSAASCVCVDRFGLRSAAQQDRVALVKSLRSPDSTRVVDHPPMLPLFRGT